MKLQNLIIIFIIIMIPIILIFSFYLNLETKTINLQTDMDEKLIEATKEAVEAFEINTTEWTGKYSSLANMKRQNLMSSIGVFTTSLADKLRIGGTSQENILNYIPAIVYIMYDGYYIYSPTYVPETITSGNGVQLFYYKDSGSDGAKVTDSATQNIAGTIIDGEPIYVWDEENGTPISASYVEETISFTTKVENAKKTYKHVLKTFVPYTTVYENGDGQDYIVNYSLDNYIRFYGEVQSKEGYILDGYTITIPANSVTGIQVNGNPVETETLTEQVYVRENAAADAVLQECKYIYNSSNDKRYYDESSGKFFVLGTRNVKVGDNTISVNNVKVYLPDVEVGHTLAEYKRVLVRTNDINYDYVELYQLINGSDENWYYKNEQGEYDIYKEFELNIDKEKDCSAINYYVEAAEFNQWIKDNSIDIESILERRKSTIINEINENLNLSLANYSANSTIDYKLPALTDDDWNQALSNISMITFFQGRKIGLKTYNNYAIVTSNHNNEYVGETSLCYTCGGTDNYYHRIYCDKNTGEITQAYKNTEYKQQNYRLTQEEDSDIKYFYRHGNFYECYDCIVNNNNYAENSSKTSYDKIHCVALARERYVQMSKINVIINLNKKVTVTFDANEGTVKPDTMRVTYNSPYGKLPTPTRPSYEFLGWYTEEGNIVTANTIVGETKNHTLYAKWKFVEYTVTFNATGGICNQKDKKVVYNTQYGELPVPTRRGCIFKGWYTQIEGGQEITADSIVDMFEDHTLYAHWEAIEGPWRYCVSDTDFTEVDGPTDYVTYGTIGADGKVVVYEIGDTVEYTPTSVDKTTINNLHKLLQTNSGYGKTDYAKQYPLTQEITGDTKLKWKVYDIKDGKLRIISDRPTYPTNVYLGGAKGYNNAVYLLDKVCKDLYSGTDAEAQSIKIEDIEDKIRKEVLDDVKAADWTGIQYGQTATNMFTAKNNKFPAIHKDSKGNYQELERSTQDNVIKGTYTTKNFQPQRTSWGKSGFTEDDFINSKYLELIAGDYQYKYYDDKERIWVTVKNLHYFIASRGVHPVSNLADFYVYCGSKGTVSSWLLFRSDASLSQKVTSGLRPIVTISSSI